MHCFRFATAFVLAASLSACTDKSANTSEIENDDTPEIEERFPDYKPKTSADTVLDYRPMLAGAIADLPKVSEESFSEAVIELRSLVQAANDNPGGWVSGNMPLGANEQEYEPSDDELLAGELGDQVSAFVSDHNKASILGMWKGKTQYPPTITYKSFTFRHVDVMGSGRFTYASAPKTVTIDFHELKD